MLIIISILTILTQVGGLVYLVSLLLTKKLPVFKQANRKVKQTIIFIGCYLLTTFVVVPLTSPLLNKHAREPVKHYDNLKPANLMTVLLNRNYVRPELNKVLSQTATELATTNPNIQINHLDANFPFIDGFPLLPHLSHKDGKKIDLSYVYETSDGDISHQQKSLSGFGVFIEPNSNGYRNEVDTTKRCKDKGYWQYDYPKYLSFGKINSELRFSKTGSKQLVKVLQNNPSLGKIFIEPHLVKRMGLAQGGKSKIRFQGCYSVRHDDHIHIQLK